MMTITLSGQFGRIERPKSVGIICNGSRFELQIENCIDGGLSEISTIITRKQLDALETSIQEAKRDSKKEVPNE